MACRPNVLPKYLPGMFQLTYDAASTSLSTLVVAMDIRISGAFPCLYPYPSVYPSIKQPDTLASTPQHIRSRMNRGYICGYHIHGSCLGDGRARYLQNSTYDTILGPNFYSCHELVPNAQQAASSCRSTLAMGYFMPVRFHSVWYRESPGKTEIWLVQVLCEVILVAMRLLHAYQHTRRLTTLRPTILLLRTLHADCFA